MTTPQGQVPTDTNTAIGAAMQLADQYAAAHAKWALEDLYGTSKSYTAKMLKERHALRSQLAAALASTPAQPAEDEDGKAFRTAARLGLTLRFYGGCAQSSIPGTPSAYEVVPGCDRAEAMRKAVAQAAEVIAAGGKAQECGNSPYDEGPFTLSAPAKPGQEGERVRDERDEFEKVFPLPYGCIRVGDGYASTGYSNWAAHTHCERWQGWQARAARAPADSVTAPAGGVDDAVDAIALARYKVVPAHESMFHRFAVVAGDGKQQLYLGREVECENMARKFAGAFLDGAFYQSNIAPTTPAQAADSVLEDAARWQMAVLVGNEVMLHPDKRSNPSAVKAYMDAVHSGLDLTGAVDAARKQGANHD